MKVGVEKYGGSVQLWGKDGKMGKERLGEERRWWGGEGIRDCSGIDTAVGAGEEVIRMLMRATNCKRPEQSASQCR